MSDGARSIEAHGAFSNHSRVLCETFSQATRESTSPIAVSSSPRYSRALKVWMSVNYFGTKAIADEIQRWHGASAASRDAGKANLRISKFCPRSIRHCLLSRARTGESCGRSRCTERANQYASRVGRTIPDFIHALNDAFSLRMCTLGFRTTMDDIREFFRIESKRALAR
jgi:hypothetical protein